MVLRDERRRWRRERRSIAAARHNEHVGRRRDDPGQTGCSHFLTRHDDQRGPLQRDIRPLRPHHRPDSVGEVRVRESDVPRRRSSRWAGDEQLTSSVASAIARVAERHRSPMFVIGSSSSCNHAKDAHSLVAVRLRGVALESALFPLATRSSRHQGRSKTMTDRRACRGDRTWRAA